jgi:hypothetical protein
MLECDARRLRSWQEWLGRVERNPDLVWEATPVCGASQLQFTVHNFAPAMQKVVVEQLQPDGSWALLHELHLVEFRAFAARPRTRIRRDFSVPVAQSLKEVGSVSPDAPLFSPETHGGKQRVGDPAFARGFGGQGKPPHPLTAICLRLAVRGVGQVAISHVELTDGVVRVRPAGWLISQKEILGRPAPRRGFPSTASAPESAVLLAFPAKIPIGLRRRLS